MYENIDTYDLIELLNQKSINLIDIRDSYKFSEGTIKNAKNISTNFLITNPENYLNKGEKYYLFCNYGSTSSKVCKFLSQKGYRVTNIIGGYKSFLEDSN